MAGTACPDFFFREPNMNAVLTNPAVCRLVLWGLIYCCAALLEMISNISFLSGRLRIPKKLINCTSLRIEWFIAIHAATRVHRLHLAL